ncbi:MAG: aminotransferase class I/II-fold pyridoxal phosphate-dependent enzyme [Paludibacteraceae bacterium]|nr:aminotransferase class I/II-fold pyridoxal phosphate-dependent enzyme [Paludibacteraceae bacterium]
MKTLPEIQPADRLSTVSEYYFSIKNRELAQLRAAGHDIISLGVGSPDLPPSEATISALCQDAQCPDANGYQSYIGNDDLRKAFADFYLRHYGVELDPKTEIQPLVGSKEGIMHISLAFLNTGDAVLIPNPGYPTYTSVSRLVGARTINYDLRDDNHWQPDFDALENSDLSGVKIMWTNYPNMPTGGCATRELYDRLVRFGHDHDILIVNDNPYSFILNEQPLSLLASDGAKDCCIELNSLSKSHNMPGWRIGMAAARREFIEWILKVKSNMDSGMYRPLQKAAVAALNGNSEEWHHEHNVRIYAARRHYAEEIMQALGCSYDPDQVGMFLWGKVPDSCANGAELADRVLYGADVFITPGFIFGTNGERYIRISLCAKEEVFEKALQRIQRLQQA